MVRFSDKVEGLRSYKAVAFISSRSSPKIVSLKTSKYPILCASLKRIVFSRSLLISFRSNNCNKKLKVIKKWKK
jgi:hypothetical protein